MRVKFDDVGLLLRQHGQDFVQSSLHENIVAIQKQNVFALRVRQAGVAGGGKAGIALADDAVGDLLRLQHLCGKAGDDVGRLVGGAVIDNQPFDLAAVFGRQAVGDGLQGSLHIVLHVVAGDNQGNQRFHTVSTGMFSCVWMW